MAVLVDRDFGILPCSSVVFDQLGGHPASAGIEVIGPDAAPIIEGLAPDDKSVAGRIDRDAWCRGVVVLEGVGVRRLDELRGAPARARRVIVWSFLPRLGPE